MPRRRPHPLLFIVPTAALLCACPPVPKRVDSLGLKPAASDVSLAVVPTENTVNAIKFADENDANHVGKALGLAFTFNAVGVETLALRKEQPLNTLVELLRANFKSVVKVSSLNEAKAQGADLIAMLDFYQAFPLAFELGAGVVGVMSIDEALLLLDPSGRELGKVTAGVKGDVGAYTKELAKQGFFAVAASSVKPSFKLYVSMQDELMAKFQAALESSQPLKDYVAARRAGTVPVAASAPAAARSDADQPGYRLAEDARRFAVVVGIEDYQSAPRADAAERDAKAVRAHLRALGYPDRNVILLAGREAGKSALEKYVESWLPRNTDQDSKVFFYFSGHGAPDVKSGLAYLLPWDGDAAYLENTAYPVKRLYEKLGALKAKRVVVALDAGFSGAGGRSLVAKGARPLVAKADPAPPPSDKVCVLAAAAADETAGTDRSQEHGLFTYVLLKTLGERGGAATVRGLYDALKPRVQDAARKDGRDQIPQLLGAGPLEDDRL